jgi:polysaccharide pyruvyl transferase WcaK-like protein
VKSAKSAGKRVVMLGQGVGPLKGTCAKRWARQAFEAADAIAVRDPGSLQTLRSLGVQKAIAVTADLAFLLPPPFQDSASTEGFNVGSMRSVGIAARPLGKGPEIADLFAEFARILFAQNYMPVLIEMDRNEDGLLIQEINKRNGGKVPDLRKLGRPQQVQTRMARMDAVVAVRLHAGILASTVGVPPFMVSYDPKVTAFARLMDLPSLPVEGLSAARLFEGFKEFMGRREAVAAAMEKRRAEQAALAAQNFELLDRVVGTKTPVPSGV